MEGWISLHRKLLDCEIWSSSQPFDMRSAWVDLLLLANHRDVEIIFDYKPMTVKRGQYLTSVRKLCARWSWSKNRTLKYLRLLETLGMIRRESNNQRTLITIEKYENYQDAQDTDRYTTKDTGIDTKRTQSGHGYATNNNDNNDNNENNIYINNKYSSSFNEFWQNYPRKQDKGQAYKQYQARLNDGYSEEQLLIACKNYAAECENENREKRYIKHGATFLSVNEPFIDYLKEGVNNERPKERTTGDYWSNAGYKSEEDFLEAARRWAEDDE